MLKEQPFCRWGREGKGEACRGERRQFVYTGSTCGDWGVGKGDVYDRMTEEEEEEGEGRTD